MLVLTRAPGESVVINETTIATVAVIGPDFVDLSLKTMDGRRLRTVTLGTAGLQPVAEGVSALLVRIRTEPLRARIGFEIPREIAFHREELRRQA